MTAAALCNTDYAALRDSDTVGEAVARMLADRVSDLPVVDASGRFVGMFLLHRLFEVLLPSAARMDYGLPDLAFMGDTMNELRRRMGDIAGRPVREFAVMPEQFVHPETTPHEIVLLLYKGANAVPVVAQETGALVGMVTPRDVLAALQPAGAC